MRPHVETTAVGKSEGRPYAIRRGITSNRRPERKEVPRIRTAQAALAETLGVEATPVAELSVAPSRAPCYTPGRGVRRSVSGRAQHPYEDDVYLVTALVPSDTACFASSPGSARRTAVWISREVSVPFLL